MLRPAAQTDIPFIAALQARPAFKAMIAEDGPEKLASYIIDPAYDLLVWERDATPLGFALLLRPVSGSNLVEVIRICIDAPGQGQGAAMIDALIDYAFTTCKARKIWLDVAADNMRARRAYERAGFHHEGTLRQHWKRRTGDHVDLALYGLLRTDHRTV